MGGRESDLRDMGVRDDPDTLNALPGIPEDAVPTPSPARFRASAFQVLERIAVGRSHFVAPNHRVNSLTSIS